MTPPHEPGLTVWPDGWCLGIVPLPIRLLPTRPITYLQYLPSEALPSETLPPEILP